MATFRVEIPGAGTFDVEGVETQDQAIQYLQMQMGGGAPKQARPPGAELGPVEAAFSKTLAPWLATKFFQAGLPGGTQEGAMRGLQRPFVAAGQMAEKGLPESVVQGTPLEGLSERVRKENEAYQIRRKSAGRGEGVDWAEAIGTGVALGPAGRILGPAASGVVRGAAQGAGQGAIFGALSSPVYDPAANFWEQKLKQAQTGAMVGGPLGALGGGLQGAQAAATRPDVLALQQRGVQPTVGQALGPFANRMEQRLTTIPYMGENVLSSRRGAFETLGRSMANWALSPIRKKTQATGREAIADVQKFASQAYDDAAALAPGGIVLPKAARADISNMTQQLQTMGVSKETASAFTGFIKDNLGARLGKKPGWTGTAGLEVKNFQSLMSDLKDAVRNTQATNPELHNAYRQLEAILVREAGRQNPQYWRAYQRANTTYARLVRLEDAAQRSAIGEGVYSPGQLAMSVRKADPSARHRKFSSGGALGQKIAENAQRVLGDTIGSSGTAERWMPLAILGGLATAPGATMAGLGGIGAGAAAYSPAVQQAILRWLQNASGQAGRSIQSMIPYGAAGAGGERQ